MASMAASTSLTPEERQTRSRQASYVSWAKTVDVAARMKPAREGMIRKFEREVDPDGTLSPDERARRVEAARKAYYTRISMLAQKKRKARTAA